MKAFNTSNGFARRYCSPKSVGNWLTLIYQLLVRSLFWIRSWMCTWSHSRFEVAVRMALLWNWSKQCMLWTGLWKTMLTVTLPWHMQKYRLHHMFIWVLTFPSCHQIRMKVTAYRVGFHFIHETICDLTVSPTKVSPQRLWNSYWATTGSLQEVIWQTSCEWRSFWNT